MKTKKTQSKGRFYFYFISLFALSLMLSSASQKHLYLTSSKPTPISEIAQNQNNEVADITFSAKGLHFEEVFTNFYRGEFIDIPFDRDEQIFAILFNTYINAYARICSASLPANKVEMTEQECATESVTTNGYGVETNRHCVRWVTVGTGLYTTPEMNNAKLELERLQAGDAIRNVFRVLSQKDPFGNVSSVIGDLQAAEADMKALFKINGCKSPGIMRFQENLRLFALNKQPIQLGNAAKSTSTVSFKNQNFTKLIEDLVFQQSKKWVMNRYETSSVSDVTVLSRNAQDLPSEIKAKYIYQGFGGRSVGYVTLALTDGLPECLYFFDAPNACRTPSRLIVAEYVKGSYLDK